MHIDVVTHLGAITRSLTTREHEGRPAHVLLAERVYPTDAADLWDALTSERRIPRWFLPISGDLRLGGRYQLEGNAGGEILRCEAPNVLALTWEFGGQVSWVTVTLTERADGTLLALEHVAHVPEEFWDQYGPGATGVGWELALVGLALHLESGAPVDPKAVEAWTQSEEGRTYVGGSSDGWAEASIGNGTDAAAARAAAARTTAFYTGSAEG